MPKITELTRLTSLADTDLFAVVDDPAGAGAETKGVTAQNVFDAVSVLAEITSGLADSDELLLIDSGTGKRLSLTNAWADYFEKQSIRYVEFEPFSFKDQTDVSTDQGVSFLHVPADINSYVLTEVHAEHETAGSTDANTSIQVHNVDNAANMLSTAITIDGGETGSDTAATAAVIDTDNDTVNTNDIVRVDVESLPSSTAPKGLIVTLGFRKP